MPKTPISGQPITSFELAEVKQDLRDAIAQDQADHERIFDSLGGLHEHVSNIRLESAATSAAVARIEVSLKSERRLQTETTKSKRTLYQVIGGIIVALITAATTYLASK